VNSYPPFLASNRTVEQGKELCCAIAMNRVAANASDKYLLNVERKRPHRAKRNQELVAEGPPFRRRRTEQRGLAGQVASANGRAIRSHDLVSNAETRDDGFCRSDFGSSRQLTIIHGEAN
jgi:hypothetical protein